MGVGGGGMDVRPSQARRAPQQRPPFTIAQLKKAIPARCFRRSLTTSASYLLADLLVAALLFLSARSLAGRGSGGWLLWPAYWICQGCVLTGVWVIAHECGHHAFSEHAWIDDAVGLALHSCLLVPYFSWKYSHRRHHSNTGSMERDEVFVPKTKDQLLPAIARLLSHPAGRIIGILTTLTLGWPSYLLFNVSGRKYNGFASHFHPGAPIFNRRERLQVLVSDASLLAVAHGLYRLASAHGGWLWLARVYGAPLLVVNGFLVLITFLQHTHPALPHYDGEEWEWLRGALATTDRDYGPLNHVFHHIADTHVAHHLFSAMPHYHAQEATAAIKPILGEYYQYDATPVWKALWREFKECVYVEADAPQKEGVLWYKSSF